MAFYWCGSDESDVAYLCRSPIGVVGRLQRQGCDGQFLFVRGRAYPNGDYDHEFKHIDANNMREARAVALTLFQLEN